ncbi:glycosyltransferase family 2 protein [uncultured Paracoccus sp.]|uniref:glycosyltransferase family 2 protein n=1 Tax=Paracoccus sp. S1E-3 TaxID=2756130 RepID=UPI0015EEE419|nr:glycosyltransferase family A protein [uncultured Paracoccus sp.]MBA4490774.1 glycosyltransferase family 2 protein [Paracoccus sp. S1E-3]
MSGPAACTLPTTSVVVVSRGRPAHLRLCLTALDQQYHTDFEIILVADPEGLRQCPDLPLKRLGFDVPNISAARNLGLAQAAGAVIAFIDDDSVAEPTWLARLAAPFADSAVIAATGWTRDRDGFRWQSQTQRITRDGLPRSLPADPRPSLLGPEAGEPVGTLGTNCAFRATALRQIGGFDPIFAYHLDESDVNMRLAAAFPRGLTAVVPDAQVIHSRASSPRRDAAAIPLDLQMQGRSAALFARRHGGAPPAEAVVSRVRRQLIRAMLDGQIAPSRIAPVLATLKAGLAAGQAQVLTPPPPARADQPAAFCRTLRAPRDSTVLGGWHWRAAALRADAARLKAEGHIPTILLLTPSFLPHRVRLTEQGWFEQTGGLWGPSEPGDSPVASWRLLERITRETNLANRRRNLTLSADVPAPSLFRYGTCR